MADWELFDAAVPEGQQPIQAILGPPRGFSATTAAALREALPTIDTRPQTIEAADRAQNQLIDLFVAHDHRAAAFLLVYHGITVAVIDAVDRGVLTPRPFFERLDGRFAERHFDGVKAELGLADTTDAAKYGLWRPSFALDNIGRHLITAHVYRMSRRDVQSNILYELSENFVLSDKISLAVDLYQHSHLSLQMDVGSHDSFFRRTRRLFRGTGDSFFS